MPSFTPAQYARRDEAGLDFTALHRVTVPRCAAIALADGKPLTHALNRLTDGGLLNRHERSLPGGLTVYTLSQTAAARRGLPQDRAALPSGAALDTALAVQAFCYLGRARRHRLSAPEVAKLLGPAAPANVPFVISDELGTAAVFRTILAADRQPSDLVKHLRTVVAQAERHATFGAWVRGRQLGFAVLCVHRRHAEATERAISRAGIPAAIVIDVGPDAEHLAAFLKEGVKK
jgi:hypothetical protein